MNKKEENLVLLYLFQNPDIKEIDIYSLSKTILKTRIAVESFTLGKQKKKEKENIK